MFPRVSRAITQKILETKIAEMVINDIYGRPTAFYDGEKMNQLIADHAENVTFNVVAALDQRSHRKPERRLTMFVADDQGPRPLMEDKYCLYLHANELVGMKVHLPLLLCVCVPQVLNFF